ncbi:DUF2865 domain-containing protein [Hoeflea sp. WL0058]|uniref:DUF2865 domain-containing protein n=1 Tax=Flavimaribacter sediminis TaxID=2865987 RepID=A0AAE2ZH02_9HYPH|nr:DUF2865 domain-containing protein [Flavimaribacter sediminis]MBW8636439.1 DUF2865 domain-containing protein [Flavimaribacter sediminis]
MKHGLLNRVAAIAALTAVAAVGVDSETRAQNSDVCARLQSQLDQYPAKNVQSPYLRRFEETLREQQLILDRARAAVADGQCTSGSITVYGSSDNSVCNRMRVRIAQLEEEVALLTQRRDALAAEGRETGRGRIVSALRANGCPVEQRQVVIHDSVRLRDRARERALDDPSRRYRTMCVRACDGYYFPISFSSSPAEFGRDAEQCARQCPGADVSLYIHSVPEQRSEDMVSANDGSPYVSLPNAFAYRNGLTSSCSCNKAPVTANRSTAPKKQSSIILPDKIPVPENKPQPSSGGTNSAVANASPDTVPSSENQVKLAPRSADDENEFEEMDPDRNVRVVGPMFLPDQSEATDRQAPDQSDSP